MATNLAIDDRLIVAAQKAGKHATKKAAVTAALEQYVQRHRQLAVLDLFGTVPFRDDYDAKKLRRRKS